MDAFSAPIYWADSEVRPMMSANPRLTKHQRQQTMCSHLYLIKASPASGVVPASLNQWKSMFGKPTLAPLIQVGYSYSFCKIRFQKVVAINRDFWPAGIGLVCTQRQKKNVFKWNSFFPRCPFVFYQVKSLRHSAFKIDPLCVIDGEITVLALHRKRPLEFRSSAVSRLPPWDWCLKGIATVSFLSAPPCPVSHIDRCPSLEAPGALTHQELKKKKKKIDVTVLRIKQQKCWFCVD